MCRDLIVIGSARPHLKVVWLACVWIICRYKCNLYNLLALGLPQPVFPVSSTNPTVILPFHKINTVAQTDTTINDTSCIQLSRCTEMLKTQRHISLKYGESKESWPAGRRISCHSEMQKAPDLLQNTSDANSELGKWNKWGVCLLTCPMTAARLVPLLSHTVRNYSQTYLKVIWCIVLLQKPVVDDRQR